MNVRRIAKVSCISALLLGATYCGSMKGVDAYMSRLDEPVVLMKQEMRVERLPNGLIHIYQFKESHEYLFRPGTPGPQTPPSRPKPGLGGGMEVYDEAPNVSR